MGVHIDEPGEQWPVPKVMDDSLGAAEVLDPILADEFQDFSISDCDTAGLVVGASSRIVITLVERTIRSAVGRCVVSAAGEDKVLDLLAAGQFHQRAV